MNMLRNTITGLLMFVFAVAADVPSEPQNMRRYGEEAEVTPHGRPEFASSAMKMEVSNDQLEDATVQEKSVQVGCKDNHKWCKYWKGYCSWHSWVQSTCPKTCQRCPEAACEGTTLKIYGEDAASNVKSLFWTLKCKRVGSTVRFVGKRLQDEEGAYYLEIKDASRADAFLSGTWVTQGDESRLEFIQGDEIDNWRNEAGGLWMTPSGHFQKNVQGVWGDAGSQEQGWVLYNSQDSVVSPLWIVDAVGAGQTGSCVAPAVGADCSCEHYQCVLQVQCMANRINSAPAGTAKDACTKMMSGGTVTDHEKQCCLELVDPCKQEDPLGDCAFRAVMHYNGHAFLEQEDGTEKVANDSRPGDQATSLDEAMTGKRSC